MLYFDADTLVYRAGFACQKKFYLAEIFGQQWDETYFDFSSKKDLNTFLKERDEAGAKYIVWNREEIEPLGKCLELVDSMVAAVINECSEKTNVQQPIKMYLSGSRNFRELIAITRKYKGNRDTAVKPVYYEDIRKHLVEVYGASIVSGFEADDAVSLDYIANKDDAAILVSADKDLDQIPGQHYDWVKKEFYEVIPKDAKTWLYTQMIAGDSTDNIPGVPGLGEKKAAKALADCQTPEDMAKVVIALYKEAYKDAWKDVLVEQAGLVYILRQEDSSTRRPLHFFDTKDGKLLQTLINSEDNSEEVHIQKRA